ncbi:division abnormally delayed protein [Plodia interpunctella]|uniref:division abnormally delayed protein n=1 Tax=Plodia interpunctella TaxID=58824 RepID=UPI00236761EB|nr:division abnormally delayed protein [Plodia interpunctella]
MRCLVVILMVVACVGSAAAAAAPAASCAVSKEFFARHNASSDDSGQPGSMCGGQCCGRGRETRLRHSVRRLTVDRVLAETRPVSDLLLSTRQTLHDHLMQLSRHSQNKTGNLLTKMYRGHAVRTRAPMSAFYEDIRTSLRTTDHDDATRGSQPPRNLAESARKFFENVFPVAYQSVLKLEAKQFTVEYEACLRDAYDSVKPFGDVPLKMGTSLSRSIKAARTLLEVLATGAGVLAASEHMLSSASEECSSRLLKVVGCAHCKGHDVKPCRAYCFNVARGCLGSLVSELDAPWAGYVEGLERLVRVEADGVLREIEKSVTLAVMYALENHLTLENKVRQECGPTATTVPEPSSPAPTVPTRRSDDTVPPLYTTILEFTASLAERKKLFYGLADEICEEQDFADMGNERCWNGDTVGEYTKPLVQSASLSDQKYNPEMESGIPQDKVSEMAALGEKLRQARQLLVTNSWGSDMPSAESFMQGDEAGEDGSGSGQAYDDEGPYDQEGSGEGSGVHEIGNRFNTGETAIQPSTPKTSAATSPRSLSAVLSLALLISLTRSLN